MLIAIDTETTGLDVRQGDRPFIVSGWDEHDREYLWQWPVDPLTRQPDIPHADATAIRMLMTSNTVIFHNTKFDVRMLQWAGILPRDYLRTCQYEDTLIAAHLNQNLWPHGLKDLAVMLLNVNDDDEKALKDAVVAARRDARKLKWNLAKSTAADYWVPETLWRLESGPDHWATLAATYAVKDVQRTMGLWLVFQELLKDKWDLYEARRALLTITAEMEDNGVSILPETLQAQCEEFLRESESHEALALELIEDPKLNINSTDQMRVAIYDTLGFEIENWTKGNRPSVAAPVLMELMETANGEAKQFILNVLLARKYQKAATYLEGYKKHIHAGKLYYNLNVTGTQTTRFSSSNPNTQNLSKGENPLEDFIEKPILIRNVFGPQEGRHWYAIDYTQLQLFIFAYCSKEDKLIDALESGWDAHDYMAHQIFEVDEPSKGQRRIAKNVNFGFIFGASPHKIEVTAGMPGLWNKVTRMFPGAHEFLQRNIAHVRQYGCITLPDGYVLHVPSSTPYAATNYLIQGIEGRIVQNAMISVDRYLRKYSPDTFMTLQIHDELVLDIDQQENPNRVIPVVMQLMEDAGIPFGMNLKTDCDHITQNLQEGVPWISTEMAGSEL